MNRACYTYKVRNRPCNGSGLPPRRPGFDPGSVHVGFVVDKVALEQVLPWVLGFSLSLSFNWCSITWKNKKKLIVFLFIFITGLHNNPQGCGASVASAAGPFSTKKNWGITELLWNNMEKSSTDIFMSGIIPEYTWTDWQKPRINSVTIGSNRTRFELGTFRKRRTKYSV
jgi:hypothetical protein